MKKNIIAIIFIVVIDVFYQSITATSFSCGNNQTASIVIDNKKICDGHDDCGDHLASDECNCPTSVVNVCLNEKCILQSNICNGKDDCQDGFSSDEENCNEYKIPPNTRMVSNKSLVPCNKPSAGWCADGKNCILLESFCDGIYDCPDFSDEAVAGPGFKCIVNSSSDSFCMLPQANLFDDSADCIQSKDICFNESGNLTSRCFYCLDGNHIISKHQVCDGVFDCMDFSDECLCNNVKTPELCQKFLTATNDNSKKSSVVIVAENQVELFRNDTCLTKALICDGVPDCPDGSDEKYCYRSRSRKFGSGVFTTTNFFDKIPFNNSTIHCHNAKFIWIRAEMCDGVPECDDLQDECSVRCGILPSFCNVNISCLAVHQICDGIWDSDVICPNGRIDEEERDCKNRFYCSGEKRISIRLDQVCDGFPNCEDESDESEERNCKDGRFYCETKQCQTHNKLKFIPKGWLLNGKSDCADSSDECPNMMENDLFGYKNQMISKIPLRIILWIIGPFSLFGNIFVLVSTISLLRQKTLKSNIAKTHHILMANLSAADGLMGVYLMILCVISEIYSGNFCLESKRWRISHLCQIMGTFVLVSTQTSVFILMLMGIFRLYTILKPFENQFSSKSCTYVKCGLILSWIVALILGVLPWFFDYFVTHYYVYSMFFQSDIVKVDDYNAFLKKLKLFSAFNDLQLNCTAIIHKNATEDSLLLTRIFAIDRLPRTDFNGEFGFYSQNSICLPNYFTRPNISGWHFTMAIVINNFIFFLLMAVVYILITVFSHPNHHPTLRRSSVSSTNSPKLNHNKCLLHCRVARLLLTDFLCWIPLCILSFLYFSGVDFDNIVIAVCGIVLLPINSALNPVLYSGLCDKLITKLKPLFRMKANNLHQDVMIFAMQKISRNWMNKLEAST